MAVCYFGHDWSRLRSRSVLERLVFLAVCVSASALAQEPSPVLTPFSKTTTDALPTPWRVVGVPRGKVPLTNFKIEAVDGIAVLKVEASKSYGNLVHPLDAVVPDPAWRLRWRWRMDQPLAGADLRRKDGDDSPLKVCALFNLPLDKLGLLERNLLRLARSASGENLPSATLCYVWDATLAPGTLLSNAYTARVRLIVVDGPVRQGQWTSHSRDLAADFRRAFGHESNELVPLEAVLVGGDTDSTGGYSLGHVGDVTLAP